MFSHVLSARAGLVLVFSCTIITVMQGGVVYAESVVWSERFSTLVKVYHGIGEEFTQHLVDPMLSVEYSIQVSGVDENNDKIRLLASNAAIPVGSRVLFEFMPHAQTDISWFGTGGSLGAPSGEFSVVPPSKDVSVQGAGIHCVAYTDGVSKICEFTQAGVVDIIFTFASTQGNVSYTYLQTTVRSSNTFWGASASQPYQPRQPLFGGSPGAQPHYNGPQTSTTKEVSDEYSVIIPVQTIPFTLHVSAPADPDSHTPTIPSLSSQGSCTVGEPHSITFVSTDPDGDTLRYGIDWNADGSIDQYVPPSGYVLSGTSQSASRTYSTAGTKTVKVLAQDAGGLTSAWATTSFSCSDSTTAGLNQGGTGGTGGSDSSTFLPPVPDLDIRAIPSLVRQSDTTQVNWIVTNITSCTVQGNNGDQWSGTESPIGGETSSPIQGQTTYTLTCTDEEGNTHTKQATVNIIPGFEEV